MEGSDDELSAPPLWVSSNKSSARSRSLADDMMTTERGPKLKMKTEEGKADGGGLGREAAESHQWRHRWPLVMPSVQFGLYRWRRTQSIG